MNPDFAQLVSDNEQERTMLEEWWMNSSAQTKMLLINAVTRQYPDPMTEIVSRFAQLALGEMMERLGK